jgi:hypothetical protein
MSYRIFMLLDRGPMDKTAICIYPWEKPCVEEVHRGACSEVSLDEMATLKGAPTVKKVKPPVAEKDGRKLEEAPGLREQYAAMLVVPEEDDPKHDMVAEYNRLSGRYGMHHSVALPVVEKVYGSVRNFIALAKPFTGSKPPKNAELPGSEIDGDVSTGEEADAETPIAEMDRDQLKAALTKAGIPFKGNAALNVLRDKLETATA